jgi:hypothetical protein
VKDNVDSNLNNNNKKVKNTDDIIKVFKQYDVNQGEKRGGMMHWQWMKKGR